MPRSVEVTGSDMTDEQRATLAEFIGRQAERKPARRPGETDRREIAAADRIWLVLAAHLRGLEATGVIDERTAAAIAGGLDRAARPGEDTARLRALASDLTERVDAGLSAELTGAVTLGIAWEDWTATATRIGLRDAALAGLDAATRMQGALLAMAELHPVSLMQGFHTGRPAQPVTFAHLLGGAVGPVGEGIGRALSALERLNRSPLGAGSMAGEVVGAERDEIAGWLGFDAAMPNTFDAVANVEDAAGALDAAAAIAAPVARMLDELTTLVRTDPLALVFADEWMRVDAQLPGFTAAEGVVLLASDLRGVAIAAAALIARLRTLPYAPLGAELDWIDRDVRAALDRFAELFARVETLFREALTVNRAYLANRAGRDYTTSNDLAAFLMTEEHLPPSVSRNIASLTMRRLRDENVEMSAITPEMVDTAAMLVIGRELKVEPETLGRWFAPRRFLERRLVEGSPAPAKTREWLENETDRNRRTAEAVAARITRTRAAEAGVRAWIDDRASADED
jgi:argininosuccinate lyase